MRSRAGRSQHKALHNPPAKSIVRQVLRPVQRLPMNTSVPKDIGFRQQHSPACRRARPLAPAPEGGWPVYFAEQNRDRAVPFCNRYLLPDAMDQLMRHRQLFDFCPDCGGRSPRTDRRRRLAKADFADSKPKTISDIGGGLCSCGRTMCHQDADKLRRNSATS